MRIPERRGGVERAGPRVHWRAISVLCALAIGTLSLALTPAANASTNFTWSGKANKGVPKWSAGKTGN